MMTLTKISSLSQLHNGKVLVPVCFYVLFAFFVSLSLLSPPSLFDLVNIGR